MNEGRRGNIVLPILLILVGAGLLLDQFGLWHPNWEEVLRFWPLLLVLLGLDLVSRGHRAARIVVGVLSVLAIVGVGVVTWPSVTGQTGLETRDYTVPVQEMDEAEIRLRLGAATMRLQADRPDGPLMQATVTYRPDRTVMRLDATTRHTRGDVTLSGETRTPSIFGSSRSDEYWQVRLRPGFPIALTVQAGVGELTLDLTDISLTRLSLEGGVGRQEVVLPESGSYEAVVNGGVGEIVIVVPEGVQARIGIDTGLGDVEVDDRFASDGRYYVSAEYDHAEERVDIDIDAGIGRIVIR